MKYCLFCLLCLFLSTTGLSAQESPLSLGIRLGGNISKINAKDYKLDPKVDLRAEIKATYTFSNDVFVESGLSYNRKASKYKDSQEIPYDKDFLKAEYLQVPVTVGLRADLSANLFVTTSMGAYCAYNIKDSEYIKQFDSGLILDIGLDYKRLTFNMGIEQGLVNIGENNIFDKKVQTQNVFATIGYRIF